VIGEVRKTQHPNPEFGHTQGDIKEKTCKKKYYTIQRRMKLRKPSILVVNSVSSYLSFFLSASIAATYIFTAIIFNGQTLCIKCSVSAFHTEIY
jgi:hypothetical protein